MKKLFLLTTLFISAQALSCNLESFDSIHCNPFDEYSNVDIPLSNNSEDCADSDFSQEAKEQYLKHSAGQREVKKWINGKRYSGKKADLEYLKKMITGKGHLNQVAKDALNECDEALCVLEKSLGSKEAAYRALNISYTSGYNISLRQTADIDYIWSLRELRDLNYSVNVMPQDLLHSSSMGNFYVLPDGYNQRGNSESVSAWASPGRGKTGEIVFRDHIRKKGDWSTSVMIHEMAHQYDFDRYVKTNYGTYESKHNGFLAVNGWKVTGHKYEDFGGYKIKREVWGYDKDKGCFPREYASESPREDFAEAITYYIKDSEYLKNKCPAVYNFMKANVFKGREYPKPQVHKTVDDYLAAHDSELRQCVSTPLNMISILENTAYFGNRQAGATGWSASNAFNIEIAQECSRDLYEKIKEQLDFDNLSCSMRTRPKNLAQMIQNKLMGRYKELVKQEVREQVKPAKLAEFQASCIEEKDLRPSCVRSKINQSIKDLGYGFDGFETVDLAHNLKTTPSLSSLGFNPTQALADCFKDSFNLNFYLDHQSSVDYVCKDQTKKFLEDNGYQYPTEDQFYLMNAGKEIKNARNLEVLSYIRDELKPLSKNKLRGGCMIATGKCVREEITRRLEEKFPEMKDINTEVLVKSIYGIL